MDLRRWTAFLVAAAFSFPADAAWIHGWPGEGDATDQIGDADGTLVGDTTFTAGFIGQGFAFDGTGDAVTFPSAVGNFGTGDFTIAFAIKVDALSLPAVNILSKRAECFYGSFWDIRSGSAGSIGLELRDGTVNVGTGTVVGVADGEFHTVVFTRTGATSSAYVDGIRRSQMTHGSIANVVNDAATKAATGPCVGADGTFALAGVLDEIRFADSVEPYLLLGEFECGDAALNGGVTAPDALVTLKSSVGTSECPGCACDVNSSGTITANDALGILRHSVAQPVTLDCPDCEF